MRTTLPQRESGSLLIPLRECGGTVATIRSQMALNDGVSRVLSKIVNGLNTTLNAFEQVQRASGRAVDVAQIAQARSQLVGANAEIQDMAEGYHRAAEQEENLNRGLRSGSNAAGSLLGKVKGIVATLAAGAGAGKLIGLSDQMTSTTARLNLMVDDGGSVEALEAEIMASAQRSRALYLDTAGAIATMGSNAGAAFSGNDELIAFMEQINKQFVIGGATAQGQSAAMLQLTQAMAAGALRGEELNSILENAPGIARAIERYMGVAEGSIKQYAEQGLITAEVVKNAMFAAADETNAKFESMPKTWSQVWIGMQNRALTILEPILTKLNTMANSEQFSKTVDGALNALAVIGALGASVLGIITGIGSGIVDNWSILGPIFWGVVAALAVYAGYLGVTKAMELASAAGKAVLIAAEYAHAAATGASVAATTAETAAQMGLNTALLACPITWIILGIIALIALFYAAVAAVNHFAGTSVSATGMITGALATAGAFIWNLILGTLELVMGVLQYLINPFINFANFIGNVFTNPVSSIIYLFQGMADNVLGLLQKIASALDFVFGSNMADTIQGWRDGLKVAADNLVAEYAPNENYQEIMNTLDFSVEDLGLERIAYGDAWDAGYSFGEGVEDTVSGLFNPNLGDLGNGADLGSGFALDNIADYAGQTADNTSRAADALTVSAEQLEYLRDIAEREAINRFTTAEVKIDMTGMTNKIDSSMDLDGVLNTFTEGFAEALETAAEGVHE